MKSFYSLAQKVLPVLTEIPPPRPLDDALIDACQNYGDAVRLCLEYRISRKNEGEIAGYLGWKNAQLSKVKYGNGYLSSEQEAILQCVCSNTAIKQWSAKCERDLERMRIKPEIPAGMEAIIARKVAEQLAAMGHARAA